MPSGEDYLLRPVLKGLCSYESLKNGCISLADIALMNDALDIQEENEIIARENQK